MNNRFYPDFIPPFKNEPHKDSFHIISSEKVGEGIISLRHFKPGEIVFTFAGVVMSDQTLYTLQLKPGSYIHDPFFMGKVLHNCDPNMLCDMETRTFTAIKPIYPNDYITMDYETTEDELFRSFECNCGAPNCRGLIQGRNYSLRSKNNFDHYVYMAV